MIHSSYVNAFRAYIKELNAYFRDDSKLDSFAAYCGCAKAAVEAQYFETHGEVLTPERKALLASELIMGATYFMLSIGYASREAEQDLTGQVIAFMEVAFDSILLDHVLSEYYISLKRREKTLTLSDSDMEKFLGGDKS